MRLIGAAERGMQLMAQRALSRKAFGKMIAQHGSFISDLAKVLIRLKKKIFFSFTFYTIFAYLAIVCSVPSRARED
jgi:hypothetical protein